MVDIGEKKKHIELEPVPDEVPVPATAPVPEKADA